MTVLTSRFRNLRGEICEGGVRVVRCPAIRRKPDRSGIMEMFSFLVSAGLMLCKENRNETEHRPYAFLFVGRFQMQKNLFYLFDRVASLRRSGVGPFVLHLVGDGPQRDELQDHAKNLGIGDSLVWHGWVDKESLRAIYRSADCLVNPSLYEGMPNAVLETMACGLPVIASLVAGNDAVVRHGETGWLFDLDKPDAFLTALRRSMEDRGLVRRMGQKARACVVNDFSWGRAAQAYADLFSKPFSSGHAGRV